MTAATARATYIPFGPPNRPPIATMRAERSPRKNAVLNAFILVSSPCRRPAVGASLHVDPDRLGSRFLQLGQDHFQNAVLQRRADSRLIDVRRQAERAHESAVGTLRPVHVLGPRIWRRLALPPEDECAVLHPQLDIILPDAREV